MKKTIRVRMSWLLLAALPLLLLPACKMAWRAVRYNVPSVTDYQLWEERPIHAGAQPMPLYTASDQKLPPLESWALGHWYKAGMSLEEYFHKTGTVAFLMLKSDTIVYEMYADEFDATSRFNSFSMSKAFLSTLVGIAVEEGYIDSIGQPIGDYLPWCRDSTLCNIRIRHLLQMTSGLASSEGYLNPWATSTRLYYGDDVDQIVHALRPSSPPGSRFFYQNINSQLLAMVLEEATGKKPAEYLTEKIWQPAGMEADAGWSLHEDTDMEKAFCCLNARARDFARFGVLMLNQGRRQNRQLVPAEWIAQATARDSAEGARLQYQFNWYTSAEAEDYYAQGLLGQFLYISPSTRTVIVRLGNSLDYNVPWYSQFKILAGLEHKPEAMAFSKADLQPYAGTFRFGKGAGGDTTLLGNKITIRATSKGLRVKSKSSGKWTASPESEGVFFELLTSRWLYWENMDTLRWERRGNEWKVYREQ